MAERFTSKHSLTVNGHRTSITLETAFWQSLKEIAANEKRSVADIVAEIDAANPGNLSGALRVYILAYFKNKS